MKKHILAIILCVICASLVLVLASCGGDTNTDTGADCSQGHNFGDWTTETYASCTSAGLKVRVCQDCSFEEEEPIPSGHKFGEWEVVTEKTCEQDGLDRRVCSVCDYEEKDEFKAEGHKFGEWEEISKGDCVNVGKKARTCSTCGEEETEDLPAAGHSFSEWGFKAFDNEPFEKAATCTEKGYLGRECTVCFVSDYKDTDPLGHTWGAWNVDGNCDDGATKTRECTVCKAGDEEITKPGEHANIVYEGAKVPTLDEYGSTGTKKCLSCGETLAPAMILEYSNIANQANVSCNVKHWVPEAGLPYLVDGNRETGARTSFNHASVGFILEFSENKNIEKVVIVVNGKGSTSDYKSVEEVTNLDFPVSVTLYNKDGNIVDQQSYKTKDTIELILKPTEEISKIAINVQCDYDHTRAIWEVETFATSVLSACDVAGAHTWGDWTNVSQPVCNQDGSLTNGLETRTCSVCGNVEENVLTASHSFGEWDESNVACLTGGTKTRTCASCNYVESETVAEGAHMETERQDVIEPTFEADGSTGKLVCTKCGATVEEAKVLSKLVNAALNAEVTTDAIHWHVVGNEHNKSNLPKVNDGDRETAIPTSSNNYNQTVTLTFADAINLKELIVVCNGKGNYGIGSTDTVTDCKTDITVVFYDADGKEISKQVQNSAGVTILTYIPEGDAAVKSVSLTYYSGYTSNNLYLWEVEAITGGDIVE